MTAAWYAPLVAQLKDLPGPDTTALSDARAHQARLTKPAGALGRLEDVAIWLAGWQASTWPRLRRVNCLVFAGNHGVASRGVSAYPATVTAQMVSNFEAGGAAINQLCGVFGADLNVIPLQLDQPTADLTASPAMTPQDCADAFRCGQYAVMEGRDLLILGEMGIGNTTAAAALCAALFGGGGADWAGPGTGVADARLAHKAALIDTALARYREAASTHPFEALRQLGGRELAAIAGAVAAARRARIPVLLDGFVCTAAAAVLVGPAPDALDHCLAAHVSAEPGHRRLLDRLGLRPLLDLGMRLGEASGAAMALGVLRGAVATHGGMATFDTAGVDTRA